MTTCPVCNQPQQVTPAGRIARHHGTVMRWSGRRWFRVTCRGSGAELHPPQERTVTT